MRLLKQALAASGALMVVAAVVAFVAPKSTHALVAALVEVTNTASNPVPNRDVDDRDRATTEFVVVPVQSLSGFSGQFQGVAVFTVPVNRRFVIDQIDGICSTPSGNTETAAQLRSTPQDRST